MKVKCIINDNSWYYITIGKIYEVFEIEDDNYKIIDDRGYECWYYEKHFKPLIRNEKINKLLE
jgi:hypothetical protein